MNMNPKLKMETTISARVIHADGTIEDLGIISRSKDEGSIKKFVKKLRRAK